MTAPRLFVGVLLALAVAVAWAPRVDHFRDWQGERPQHFAGDVVSSSADSYYWFRIARELRAGTWVPGERDTLRRHPDGIVRGEAPWMSRAIAVTARWTDGDVYRAGLWVGLVTSCLFAIPLALYAASAGWPAAGVLGALVGSASPSVAGRTGIHRVDTDGVNLFALWWICLLFGLLWPDARRARQVAVAAGAGLSVALFVAWYSKPGLQVLFAACFALCLIARRFAWRRGLLLAVIFLLLSNPLALGEAPRHFLRAAKLFAALTFEPRPVEPLGAADAGAAPAPRTGAARGWSPLERTSFSIEEQVRGRPREALERLLKPAWLAALGLIGFAGWALRDRRRAVALLPLVLLGGMGLVTARRFLLYLAPLAGFGLGVLLTIAVRAATRRTRFARHAEPVACVLALAAFAALLPGTAYHWRPSGSIPAAELAGLQRCARDLPAGSVVWHSWGYGYVVQDVMGAATFTDGGGPQPAIDHLLVKALTDPDPEVLQRTIAYLDRHPQREVIDAFREDYEAAYRRLLEEPPEISRPAYVLFTPRSMRDFTSYARRGRWDPTTGQPGSQGVRVLNCRGREPGLLRCSSRAGGSFRIHTKRGTLEPMRGQGPGRELAKLLVIRKGFVERALGYSHRSETVLELVRTPAGPMPAFAMQGAAFASNLNRLYVLGRPDAPYLELVCDEFPHARLYRVDGRVPLPEPPPA